MDLLTITLLAVVMLLGVALAVILLRQGSGRDAEQMRQQLALALSQQAETVQRVERSLREQEQALSKAVGERLDRTEKATGQIVTDLRERLVRIDEAPVGAPLQPGRACVAAHDHDEDFTWQRNFHVRGELVEDGDGWAVVPRKLVGGFELPPGSLVVRMRQNLPKIRRFRKIAKKELAKRGG